VQRIQQTNASHEQLKQQISKVQLERKKKVSIAMSRTSDGPFDNHVLYQSLSVFVTSHAPRWKKRLLNVGDSFMSLFVVSPLVISHWRGTWQLMDFYGHHFPGLNCFIFGAVLHCFFAIIREPLHGQFNSAQRNHQRSLTYSVSLFVLKKVYTLLFSVGCIMHWRGGWALMEETILGKYAFLRSSLSRR